MPGRQGLMWRYVRYVLVAALLVVVGTLSGAGTFGPTAASSFTVVNDSTITATTPPGTPGTTVTINDTAPTTDNWNLARIEID